MAKVSTYLNFNGNTEEAFNFYKTVFGTEFEGELMRFKDAGPGNAMDVPESEGDLVMHVTLPILGGYRIMGTDITQAMGMGVIFGNNSYINLEPDTREETNRLFGLLSEGGEVEMPLKDEFWGLYGACKDKFGVQWMFNCDAK